MGGQPESDIEPPPTCSLSQNEVEEDIYPPTSSPLPTCSQPQNKIEKDMGGAKNNRKPPPTYSQLQNKEEQDMVDSKFEDSENEEKYMPCCMNDPSGGWKGFRENYFESVVRVQRRRMSYLVQGLKVPKDYISLMRLLT